MPTLADLDDPRPSRAKPFLLAAAVVAPLTALGGYLLLPALHASIVGSAADFDERLRLEDSYMQGVCNVAMDLGRDETLCKCVLAVEYPSLDCRAPYMGWSLDRMLEACAEPSTRDAALSFCACVDSVDEQRREAPDPKEKRQVEQRYAGCTELEDALYLPTVEELVVADEPSS